MKSVQRALLYYYDLPATVYITVVSHCPAVGCLRHCMLAEQLTDHTAPASFANPITVADSWLAPKHTDNEGQLAGNMELSKQRAATVVKALTAQYGVAASRVQPYGDGPYAPVASNDTEDGRTLNRRVELVKQ